MAAPISEAAEKQVESHKTALVTLLFTDIIGAVRLKQKLGDAAAVRLILRHHDVARTILKEFPDAREISSAGDQLFITFVKPSDAVLFALRLQVRLRTELSTEPEVIRDRIGIHLGEVLVSSDSIKPSDFQGMQVDTANRVMSLAGGDQILCTRPVFDNARQIFRGQELKDLGPLAWLNHGEYRLKGVEDAVEVCEVGEVEKAVLEPPKDSEKALRHVRKDEEELCGWRPAPEQRVPNSEWVLKAQLGKGGFGETWKAEHRKTKELRAFKFCFTANRVRSLKREMKLFRLLKEKTGEHAPFVRLYEVYLDRAPYYLEMEYIDGPNLEQWLKAEEAAGRKVDLEVRLEIVAQIAEALALAHSESVLHNDVKPTNILMSRAKGEDGRSFTVKLSDFGIGQIMAPEKLMRLGIFVGETLSGTEPSSSLPGSRIYMAPELLREGGKASPKSDFYSLGVVLYQSYLGDMQAPLPTDWQRHVKDPILRADLRWLLTGDPSRRPSDGNEIARRVRRHAQRLRARRAMTWVASILMSVALALAAYIALGNVQHIRAERAAFRRASQEKVREEYCSSIAAAQACISYGALGKAQSLLENCPANLRNWEWYRLELLCKPDLMFLKGHSGAIGGIAFSPDVLHTLAAGSSDETIKVWDLKTGRETKTLKGHTGRVWAVVYSRDGKQIASAGMDETVRIWDAVSGREVKTLRGHTDYVRSVSFRPDGKRVASASSDGTVKIWDIEGGKEVRTIKAEPGQVWSVVYSPDGKWIAMGGKDETIKVWDAESGQEVMTYKGDSQRANGPVRSVAFSADGKQVIGASSDKTIKILDAASGRVVMSLAGHTGQIWGIAVSPDGTRITAGSDDDMLIVWDVHSGRQVAIHNLLGLMGYSGPVLSVAFSPDGKWIAFGSTEPTVKVLATESRRCRKLLLHGHTDSINAFASTPDGRRFATGSSDNTAIVWDGETGAEVVKLTGHSQRVMSVCLSPDGRRVVTGGDDRTVRVWDALSGAELQKLEHAGQVKAIAFSPDGKRIVSGSEDMTLKMWDAETYRDLVTFKGHSQPVSAIAFSPDGWRIASGSGNPQKPDDAGELKLWDAETGQELKSVGAHPGAVLSVAFSPDGKRVASGSWDKNARIWDVETGEESASLKEGHTDAVWAVGFSPDGTRVVTGSGDETVKIWDAQTGREILSLRGHAHPIELVRSPDAKEERSYCVNYVGFSPDGRRITSASCDGAVMLWESEK